LSAISGAQAKVVSGPLGRERVGLERLRQLIKPVKNPSV
jgi:hypothetical protein